MYPVLFTIFDIDILSLSVLLVLAFVLFNLVLYRLLPVHQLNIGFWTKYIIPLSLVTILVARLTYVATFFDKLVFESPFWENWSHNLAILFNPDGFSFYGGIVFFAITFYFLARRAKEPIFPWLDLFTIAFFSWLTVASIGYFMGGIYYGTPTNVPWGIVIDNIYVNVKYTTPIHPVQLYVAAGSFITFMIGYIFYRRQKLIDGAITLGGGLILALMDFASNFIRGDDTIYLGNWRLDQILDLGLIVITTIALVWLFRSHLPTHSKIEDKLFNR